MALRNNHLRIVIQIVCKNNGKPFPSQGDEIKITQNNVPHFLTRKMSQKVIKLHWLHVLLFFTLRLNALPFPGERNRFFVDTMHAGSGALSVTVDGPSKVQLNCNERPNGYEFSYLPFLPGEYLINIKYGDMQHIVGSPFKVSCLLFG